jgi:ubiquinone/menaquinone biosynthesis C-methylase UbiE
MVEYARKQAKAQQVADRVSFHVMDALLILEFPADFFDLVNLRFGISFVRTWEWPKLLSEMQRVSCPGGVIRVTDEEVIHPSNSSALTLHFEMVQCGFFRSGHLFEEQTDGLIAHLPELLTRHGVQQVQAKAYALEFRAGTPEGQAYYENALHAFHTVRPFLERRGCAPLEYETTCQQALAEMQQPDFCSTWKLLTTWGTKPREMRERARD